MWGCGGKVRVYSKGRYGEARGREVEGKKEEEVDVREGKESEGK